MIIKITKIYEKRRFKINITKTTHLYSILDAIVVVRKEGSERG